MPSRSSLSPEERDSLLREVRGGAEARIPVRTFRVLGGGPPGPRASGPSSDARTSGAGRTPGRAGGDPPRTHSTGSVLPPSRRPWWRRVLLPLAVVLLVVLGLAAAKLFSVGNAVLNPDRSIIGQLSEFLFRRGTLAGESENRVNILLVAIGGEGHQGENLADTIMLASFRPVEKDVAILSIPRDLYVKIPGAEFYARVNAVHAYGENQRRGEGLRLLKKAVQDVTGQEVHYVARVDFTAFKRVVDEIGGIDITIPRSFYDYWHKISFPEGTEHMNGERALAYVRARYIEGSEGGDFKRQERIQQALLAIRKKVLSAQTAVDIRALAGILDALHDNVATNFSLAELKRVVELTRTLENEHIQTAVLTTGPNGLLVGTTEILSGRPAAVLRPRAGIDQYEEIRRFAADIFAQARIAPPPSEGESATAPAPSGPSPSQAPAASVADEQPTVEVRNGTSVVGLAARVAKQFEKQQFTIPAVGNAAIRNRTQTVIVDRTGGKKPSSLRALQETLGITTAVQFPEAEKETVDANFVVFLGTDVAEKFKR